MEQENEMVEQENAAQPVAQEEPEAAAAEAVVEPASSEAEEQDQESRPSKLEDLKIGMRVQGTVKNMVEFGAFVDIGVGRDGLAHISTLKRAGVDQTLKVGDKIDVQVRRVDLDNNRVSLTVPGAGRDAKTTLKDLQVGSMVTGRVVRLVDFGAFVDVGAQTDGLLHVSQLSNGFVRHPSEAVQVGDEIEVRILEVDMDRRRISLTMKDEQQSAPQASSGPRRESSGSRRGGGGRSGGDRPRRAPIVMSTADDDPKNQGPTAFEVAWQEALANRKGGRG